MLVNIGEQKALLDSINGFKEVVTDHSTVSVLNLMEYQTDKNKYEIKLSEVVSNRK